MNCIEAKYMPYHAEIRLGRGPVVVFAPHPDDEVFGCGGAILQHVADGDDVRVVVVTDGAFGAGEGGGDVFASRQAESRAAARILGYGEPDFWGLPDRGLAADEALIQRIEAMLRETPPAFVYAPSWWEIHPDHTALSLAVTAAVRRLSEATRLVLYEIGMTLPPNRLLDISHVLVRKCAAMACFPSQLRSQAYDQHVLALNCYRTFTLPAGVKAAEAYRLIEQHALPGQLRGSLAYPMDAAIAVGSDALEPEPEPNPVNLAANVPHQANGFGLFGRIGRRIDELLGG